MWHFYRTSNIIDIRLTKMSYLMVFLICNNTNGKGYGKTKRNKK